MTNIIIDTNIIISYPKILGLSIKNTRFIVPSGVINELNEKVIFRGSAFEDRLELIDKASLEGTITIINTDSYTYKDYHELIKSYLVSGTDISVIAVALTLKQKGEDVKLATFDRIVSKIGRENGLITLSKSEIEVLLEKFEKPESKNTFFKFFYNILLETVEQIFYLTPIGSLLHPLFVKLRNIEIPSVQGKIVFFERKETTNLIVGIIIGVLITLLTTFVYIKLDTIIKSINIWGTITCTIILGIILFIIREKQRLAYGVFEFLVGILSIVLLFNSENFNYSKINFTVDFYIKIAAGLYIMVRGQDNIVKAIKGSKFGIKLQKYGIGN